MSEKIKEGLKIVFAVCLLLAIVAWEGTIVVRVWREVVSLLTPTATCHTVACEDLSISSPSGTAAHITERELYLATCGVKPVNGKIPTLKDLLKAALEPIGHTLYVYGGGWNEEDTAAGTEALSYGVSPRWQDFFDSQNENYRYENHLYSIHDGLDCTGYVGYSLYQMFGAGYAPDGYVFESGKTGEAYRAIFGGEILPPDRYGERNPGDIMVQKGHVYLVLGKCSDGSVVFLHASPPDVTIGGTVTPDGNENSEAITLAHRYMEKIAPEAHRRYENCRRGLNYLTSFSRYRLPENVIGDPDGYRTMSAAEVLADLIP